MSGVARAFSEWWSDEYGKDHPTGTEFDQEDMSFAFAAGWDAAMDAEWVTSSVPMLGVEGGAHRGWAHPGHPE